MYKCFKIEQLLELGCCAEIWVKSRETNWNGNVTIRDCHGWHERGLSGFDPDCEIEGLEHALEHITVEKAKIIWEILKTHYKSVYGIVESSSRQDYSGSERKKQTSKMGKLVREKKWLPDKNNNLRKPSDLLLTDLPNYFERESPEAKNLAEKLGFKKDIEQQLVKALSPEERERYELAKKIPLEKLKQLAEETEKEKISIQQEVSTDELDYKEELERAFTRLQTRKLEEVHIPPDPISDSNRRREKTREDIREAISNEPPQRQRFKRVPAKKWEEKNNEVRTFLKEQYGGKCQICGYTFTKRDGEPYFEGLYLVSRTKASWIDRPGNVLCLCANCCAKFEHGQVEAENVLVQIQDYHCSAEGGVGIGTIPMKLCNEDVALKFSERHILDLQEMLKTDEFSYNYP